MGFIVRSTMPADFPSINFHPTEEEAIAQRDAYNAAMRPEFQIWVAEQLTRLP
jgi:hypothetical protein